LLWNIEVAIHISVRLHYTLLSTQTFVYGTRLLYYYTVSEFLFFVLVQGHVYISIFFILLIFSNVVMQQDDVSGFHSEPKKTTKKIQPCLNLHCLFYAVYSRLLLNRTVNLYYSLHFFFVYHNIFL